VFKASAANPKQIRDALKALAANPNYQMFKTTELSYGYTFPTLQIGAFISVLVIGILVIRVCFDIRYSIFDI